MNKSFQNLVISPDNGGDSLPVVYLLHGHGGSFSNWFERVPRLKNLAEKYRMVIVCPEGTTNSWYLDSPKDSTVRFETYIIDELIPIVDKHYQTSKNPKLRFITGFSMGGHGAMYLAIRNIEMFGGVGSLSGGLDLRPFPESWEIKNLLGEIENHPENWADHSVIKLLDRLQKKTIPILIDCGVSDFFIHTNRDVHKRLLDLEIKHEYIERPGGHTWDYWSDNVEFHFLFFDKLIKRFEY
jgi:S-formylglutathione hydrolase FrmB